MAREKMERLDEIEICSHFTLEEAISSLKFHWNLQNQNNQTIWFEIWGKPIEKLQSLLPPKKEKPVVRVKGYST
jgi:hypothetical protein